MTLVLLSGPIAVGKSAVAAVLIERYSFSRISSGRYLAELAKLKGLSGNRGELQELGDTLDRESDYKWLIDDVAKPLIENGGISQNWLIDSVRKARQIEHFRVNYGTMVLHVHLSAEESILRKRYEGRLASSGKYEGVTPYSAAVVHPNELSARSLVTIADLQIDLGNTSPDEAARSIIGKAERGKAKDA